MSDSYDFWDLMDLSRTNHAEFLRTLNEMPEADLVTLYWKHVQAENDLKGNGLVDHFGDPASEDGLSMLAEWIVDEGADYYEEAMNNLSKVPRRAPMKQRDVKGQMEVFTRTGSAPSSATRTSRRPRAGNERARRRRRANAHRGGEGARGAHRRGGGAGVDPSNISHLKRLWRDVLKGLGVDLD